MELLAVEEEREAEARGGRRAAGPVNEVVHDRACIVVDGGQGAGVGDDDGDFFIHVAGAADHDSPLLDSLSYELKLLDPTPN